MKIHFKSDGCIPAEKLESNRAYNRAMGMPSLGDAHGKLAIVGGGPSVAGRISELQKFNGDIWAINGAWHWCLDQGIDATFYTIDPSPIIADMCGGAKCAVLASNCDPLAFHAASSAYLVEVDPETAGPTSASTAPSIAIDAGYSELIFYGCESSWGETTHIYPGPPKQTRIIVESDGRTYPTSPGMLMQAEWLSGFIRQAPNVFSERSGGLLAAMVNDSDFDITHGPQSLLDAVT